MSAGSAEPRILLFTGKGGVGKSTLAAGTAALAADRGSRTLVLSTDTAHSLGDAFATPVGAAPAQVADRLWVQQVDSQARFERSWAEIQRYLLSVLDAAGMDPVAAEELTVVPGAEEVMALLEVREQAQSSRWDVIVLDCAPTAETLRLLALPEALGWYFDRILPIERRVVKTFRPLLTKASGVPMPGDSIFDAVLRLKGELDQVRTLLTGPHASVRLVLTPEKLVLAEARRTYATLSLFGYRVDGVVANRVFPPGSGDPWLAGWAAAQAEVLGQVEQSFVGLPQWRSPYRDQEPLGIGALVAVAAAAYGADDPLTPASGGSPMAFAQGLAGPVLHLALPHVTSAEVDLARHGQELVITVGAYRRLVTLPAMVHRLRVVGAGVREGRLEVRFEGSE